MTDETFIPAGALVETFGGFLEQKSGECQEHGVSSVMACAGRPWHCPKCLEIKMVKETQAIWLAERSAALMQFATIPRKYIGQRFDGVTPEQKLARSTVRAYRDFILRDRAWASLILIGLTGTGKTLLACEFAQSLITNASKSVRYITATGMISEIQASYGREGKSEEAEIMRFVQFDVLILDEIDAIRSTDNANLLLTEIMNRRYNEGKPVVVISNQPFDNLAKFVGERVFSRLHENAFQCAFNWPDYRKSQSAAV